MTALLVSNDLFFVSKVTGTAQGLGYQVDTADDALQLTEKLAQNDYQCVFLDLTSPISAVDVMQAVGDQRLLPVIAFGSHVDVQMLAAAEQAGCSEVMPRSKFSGQLPAILNRLLGDASQ